MASQEDEKMSLGKWQELEEVMVQTYQDDERRWTKANEIESQTEPVHLRLFVASTGYLFSLLLHLASSFCPNISSFYYSVLLYQPTNHSNISIISVRFYHVQIIVKIGLSLLSKKTPPVEFELYFSSHLLSI